MENNPYAAPGAVVDDAPSFNGDDLEARKASRGQRLGAALLDDLFFGLCLAPVFIGSYKAYIARAHGEVASSSTSALLMGLCGAIALCLAIYNLVLLHRNGQTLGKRILGIKIVRSNGDAISLGRIIGLRALPLMILAMIPVVGRFVGLIDVLFIFGQEKRCGHDMIADTIVINV